MPGTFFRALFIVLLFLLWPSLLRAQENDGNLGATAQLERDSLIAGGYPLFDTNGLLLSEDREVLLGLLSSLQDCCDLNVSLVLQDQPRNATASQDLDVLLRQLQRTGLWTDQSLLILLQSNPRQALAIRATNVSGRTQSLGSRELQALGLAAADGHAGPALIQALEALSTSLDDESLSLGAWTLGQTAQDALYHTLVFWIFACVCLGVLWASRRRQALPHPALLKVMQARMLPLSSLKGSLKSGAHILLIHQGRAPRHWPTLLAVALLFGFGGVIVVEPAFVGLETFWEQRRLWLFADYWMARAGLSIAISLGMLGIFSISPLGSWITPGALAHRRQSWLLARRLQFYDNLSRVTLMLVWRRVSRRLEIWEPAHASLANPRMETLLDRLEADMDHGDREKGMQRFLAQYYRLIEMRGMSDAPGEVQEMRI